MLLDHNQSYTKVFWLSISLRIHPELSIKYMKKLNHFKWWPVQNRNRHFLLNNPQFCAFRPQPNKFQGFLVEYFIAKSPWIKYWIFERIKSLKCWPVQNWNRNLLSNNTQLSASRPQPNIFQGFLLEYFIAKSPWIKY